MAAARGANDFSNTIAGAGIIVDSLKNLHKKVLELVDTVNDDINTIRSKETSRIVRKKNECSRLLTDAAQKLHSVVCEAEHIVQIGSDKERLELNLRRRQLHHDPDGLVKLTDQLKSAIARVEQARLEFEKPSSEASKTSDDAVLTTNSIEMRTRQGRERTKMAVFLTTGIIAIVIIILAGPVYGTAAATVVVAIGVGVAYCLDQRYAQLQKWIKNQCSIFEEWAGCARDMEGKVNDLHQAVKSFSVVVEDLERFTLTVTEFTGNWQQSVSKIGKECSDSRKTTKSLNEKLTTGHKWNY